jgi:hypothetical protein
MQHDSFDELTPTERLALEIADLRAQLELASEALFFEKARSARLNALLACYNITAEP